MVAYTACSSIMTLVVPYYELDDRAGLVQVWGQLGYPVVQWAVSFGAIAALLASMFGSMFPMPRIAYAMAKGGLISENFSHFYLVQLIKQPILRIRNFNFPNLRCCKVFLFFLCVKSYIGIF